LAPCCRLTYKSKRFNRNSLFYSNFKLFEDERRDGRPEHDEDETVQGEAPEAEVVPILGAAALRLHVGNQSHGQRARSRLVARSD